MRLALALCTGIAGAAAGLVYFDVFPTSGFSLGRPAATAQSKNAQPSPAVKVTTAEVLPDQVPIYLTGIGTVQAYNTVSVKSRVDGDIIKVMFDEGQDVTVGQPLVLIDPRPFQAQLEMQEAILQKDQALLAGALLDLQRYETLVLNNAISKQQLDQTRATVAQYRAQVKGDEAQVAYARTQLNYTTIRAPIAGRVGIRQVDEGNFIRVVADTVITVITQLQPISVVFTLAATNVANAKLVPGQVRVPVAALAADNERELDRGFVEIVDNQIDQATGTIRLKATFPNKRLRLWPGDFVNGRMTIDTRDQGLTIPSSAIRHGPRGEFVWVVRNDSTVEIRPVQIIQTFGARSLIDRGLKPKEIVVTDGHYRLESGLRVEATTEISPRAELAAPSSKQ